MPLPKRKVSSALHNFDAPNSSSEGNGSQCTRNPGPSAFKPSPTHDGDRRRLSTQHVTQTSAHGNRLSRGPVSQLSPLQRVRTPPKRMPKNRLSKNADMPMMKRMLGRRDPWSQDYSRSGNVGMHTDSQSCREMGSERSSFKREVFNRVKCGEKDSVSRPAEKGAPDTKLHSNNPTFRKGEAQHVMGEVSSKGNFCRTVKGSTYRPKICTTSDKLRMLSRQDREAHKASLARKKFLKFSSNRPPLERERIVDLTMEEWMPTTESARHSMVPDEYVSESDDDELVESVLGIDTSRTHQPGLQINMEKIPIDDARSESLPKRSEKQDPVIELSSEGEDDQQIRFSRLSRKRRKRHNRTGLLVGIPVNSALFKPHSIEPTVQIQKPVVSSSNLLGSSSSRPFKVEAENAYQKRQVVTKEKLSQTKGILDVVQDGCSDRERCQNENVEVKLEQERVSLADRWVKSAAATRKCNEMDAMSPLRTRNDSLIKRSPISSDRRRTRLSTAHAERSQPRLVSSSKKRVMPPQNKDGPCEILENSCSESSICMNKEVEGGDEVVVINSVKHDDRKVFLEPVNLSSRGSTSTVRSNNVRLRPLNARELAEVKSMTRNVRKNEVLAIIEEARITLRGEDIACLRGSRWLNDEVMNSFVALINARNRDYFKKEMDRKIEASQVTRHHRENSLTSWPYPDCQPFSAIFDLPRPRTHVFNTFFFSRLVQGGYDYHGVRRWLHKAGHHVKDLDLILIPINLSNFHWVLVSIDLRNRHFTYMDSMLHRDRMDALDSLKKWLVDEVRDKMGDDAVKKMDIEKWRFATNPNYLPPQRDSGSCGIFALYTAEYLERGKRPDFTQKHILTMRQRTVLFLKHSHLPP